MNPSVDSMTFVRELVRRRAAIVVENGKEYLVESRLLPVARSVGLTTVDELVARLRSTPEGAVHKQVIEAMTTNETSFFRDIHPFDCLRRIIVPELIQARAAHKQLRIWCAAASTGQEPYTIAMVIREHFPELASWNIQFVATDINATVLARAREGVFKQLEVNRGLPAAMLVKYFDRVGTDWQIKKPLRDAVQFRELNLLEAWPLFGKQDIVFMRNVLIYFDVPTKRQILSRVRQNLADDGALFLGGAETTMNIEDSFEPAKNEKHAFYRIRRAATPDATK